MRSVHRAGTRFHTTRDDIETYHSFSYGDHYDPHRVGFGPLRAVNEEHLAPGAEYAAHRHRESDIVTWVLDGTLEHRDTAGGGGTLGPGTLQWLRAGSGVEHTERNASADVPLTFVQMILQGEHDVAPEYGTCDGPVLQLGDRVLIVAVGHQVLPPADRVHVHVLAGTVRAEGYLLHAGDELWSDEPVPRLACDDRSAALVWLLGADVRLVDGAAAVSLGDCLGQLGAVLGRPFADVADLSSWLEWQAPRLERDLTILTTRSDRLLSGESPALRRRIDDVLSLAIAHSRGRLHVVSYAPKPSAAIRASWR